jgi:hypothetical protein
MKKEWNVINIFIITQISLGSDEFGTHGEYGCDDLGTGPGYFLMLSLCAIGRTQFDEMYPRPQGTIHIQPAFSETLGQYSTGLFLGYAILDGPGIGVTHGE